jgi:hypothetical protein
MYIAASYGYVKFSFCASLKSLSHVYFNTKQETLVGAICTTVQQVVSSKLIYLDKCEVRNLKHFVRFKNSGDPRTRLPHKYFSKNRRYKASMNVKVPVLSHL